MAAIESVVLRLAPHAARALAIEHVNVFLAPFFESLNESALAEVVRELLRSPAFTSVSRRGSLLRLELGMSVDVPDALAHRPAPAPASPGSTYGNYGDSALRVLRAMVREARDLRLEGRTLVPAMTVALARPSFGATRTPQPDAQQPMPRRARYCEMSCAAPARRASPSSC